MEDIKSEYELRLEKFQAILHTDPPQNELSKTPDNKALDLSISYVEMKLDEYFFGQWCSENFKWSVIQNEVQGSIDLKVKHPISKDWIIRTGAASIIITVDALSEAQKSSMTNTERNIYALSIENKKPNALDLAFPKLKAECIKNAAKSLGKAFGRDINRKIKDNYTPLISTRLSKKQIQEDKEIKSVIEAIERANSLDVFENTDLTTLIYKYDKICLPLYEKKKNELKNKK